MKLEYPIHFIDLSCGSPFKKLSPSQVLPRLPPTEMWVYSKVKQWIEESEGHVMWRDQTSAAKDTHLWKNKMRRLDLVSLSHFIFSFILTMYLVHSFMINLFLLLVMLIMQHLSYNTLSFSLLFMVKWTMIGLQMNGCQV